jgi:hypothetical protein
LQPKTRQTAGGRQISAALEAGSGYRAYRSAHDADFRDNRVPRNHRSRVGQPKKDDQRTSGVTRLK